MEEAKYKYQGVARTYQRKLLDDWYSGISSAKENNEKVAYLFISGNIAELLRVFDFHLVYPEVNALQCGVKKVAGDFIMKAEDIGYSSDVCGYVKNDIGLLMSGNIGPFGKISPPDLLVCTYSGCMTYVKWFEALAKAYGTELFMLDIPFLREGKPTKGDMKYIRSQLEELIEVCERKTGIQYDEDKLKEILGNSVKAEDLWVNILQSAKHEPSPFDAFFEAVFFMAPIYVLRGTEECVEYYQKAKLEIEERIQHKTGPIPEEKFRIVMEGPPPWPHFRSFWELFKKWDVCAVASTYSKVGGIWDFGFRHDPTRPLESIAEYATNCYTNYNWKMRSKMIKSYIDDYNADALVIHSVKSCRAFSVGQADARERFIREYNIPTLFIESDLADPRYFSEAQMRNRIDAFFESLEHRRLVGG
ncbi:MAG: 2-hydroxyacyl-CoA dehydratase [Candidatus Marinimicrobia bacterium]|nr:2-hydroxyacyl-CoA dehydratase [Candidatus Neomarinimicrobiota bacterium]